MTIRTGLCALTRCLRKDAPCLATPPRDDQTGVRVGDILEDEEEYVDDDACFSERAMDSLKKVCCVGIRH